MAAYITCGGDDLAVAVDGGTRRRVGDSHRWGCFLPTAVCIIAKAMAADGSVQRGSWH